MGIVRARDDSCNNAVTLVAEHLGGQLSPVVKPQSARATLKCHQLTQDTS